MNRRHFINSIIGLVATRPFVAGLVTIPRHWYVTSSYELDRALESVENGDIIHIEAGTYTLAQVQIRHGDIIVEDDIKTIRTILIGESTES